MTTQHNIQEQLDTLEEKLSELDSYEDTLFPKYRQTREELVFLWKHTKIQKYKTKHNYTRIIYSLDFALSTSSTRKSKLWIGTTN